MTDTECPNGIRKRRPIYLAFRYVCPYDVGGALMKSKISYDDHGVI